MKLTLQILDAGDTFYRPLEDRPLVVGSADGADLVLRAAGVEAEHARIEPDGDGRYRIVDLSAEIGTRVNDEEVAQWRLAIGDRIEVGGAVLVVGQQVARPATPADVLDDGAGLARAGAQLRRARLRDDRARGGRGKLLAIGVGIVAVLAVAVALTRGGERPPMRWGDLVVMRRQAQVEDGRALAEQIRATWALDDPEKNARIDEVVADLAEIDRRLAEGRARIREQAPSLSRGEQLLALREDRPDGDDTVPGIVARRLLSELDELRLGLGRRFEDESTPERGALAEHDDGPAAGPGAGIAAAGSVPAVDAPVEAAGEGQRFVAEQIVAIDALRAAGRFSEALEMMRFALSATDAAFAAPLREADIRLRAEVDREMRAVVDSARNLARGGSVDGAIALLRTEGMRFPADGEFSKIAAEQRELEDYRADLEQRATFADAPGTPSAPALAELRDLLAAARHAERDGQFAAAAVTVGRAADAVRSTDPLYAANLDGRRQDLDLLARLDGYVREQVNAGREVVVELAERGPAQLTIEDGGLRAGGGGPHLQWSAIAPASIASVLSTGRGTVDPEVLLGGAVHAYRGGERDVAESLLARAIQRDAALQPRVDGVIGRGRGETPGAAGYKLVGDGFVAVRELETRKRAKELEKVLARIVRLADERRDAELEQVLAKGPQELDALVIALRSTAERSAARIEQDAFRRHWEKVAQVREALDAARAHAKELIYDEVRYFYPYKPPAVSAEKASEYWKVQGEVDERVAAVRELWETEGPSKRVPKKLADDLAQLDWSVAVLAGFGERIPGLEDRVGWARALPRDEPLAPQTFCWDLREATERRRWTQVLAFNQKKSAALTRAESAQVEITNAYRLMFGHRPLAVNTKLVEAARGHAEEMSRLGYFSHFSPTPGRKTPFERMKLAGYTMGVSENIANHPSAASAHDGWIHSSGHHRNLLMPSHHEFAVGHDGRSWVQNFGRGEDFTTDPDWTRSD